MGSLAPEFGLLLFNGETLEFADLRGQPIVLNFWATWCPPCRLEMRDLQTAWEHHQREGVMFIGVNVQDTPKAARALLHDLAVTYPNGPDPTVSILIDYGVSGMPTTFFIDSEGKIVKRWVGGINEEKLNEFIDQIQDG